MAMKPITINKRSDKDTTFTKSYMTIVVLLYFIGAFMGTLLVTIAAIIDIKHNAPLDTAMFIAYAAYLGGPTSTAIGFYAWKSKAENVIKIKNSFDAKQIEQSMEAVDLLSKMGGN